MISISQHRTNRYLVAPAFVAWMALSATPGHTQVADQRTPTLDSKRTTDPNAPAPEPSTDVVAGTQQPSDPLTNLTPGAPANPETPTPGTNLDAQAASGLADARLAASQNAPILDLTQALTLALRDNPQRKAAYAAIQAAQARTGTAKSAGRFQAAASGNAGRTQNFGPRGNSNNFGGGGNTGGTTGGTGNTGNNQSRTRDTLSANLTGQLPIYTGGRVKASTRVALANLQAQQAQGAQVEQDLILNTTSAYLTVLRTQQLLDVTESNLAVSRERLRVARVRYDAGASARLDVLSAETDLANARQLRIQAANNLGQSASNFNVLLGRAPSTPFRVVNITSLQLPADLPLYVQPAASFGATPSVSGGSAGRVTTQGGTTTPATNAGTPGITAPTQTNPGVPGGGINAGQTNTIPGNTTSQPGSTGIGATQPGAIGQPGTAVGGGDVPSPAPNIPNQGGTTTAPGTTSPTTGTTAPGGTSSTGTAAVTPGVSTTPGVTTQTPGAVSGSTTNGTTGGTTGGFGTGSSGTTGGLGGGFGGGPIVGGTTGGVTAPAGGVSDGASGGFGGGTISSTAGAQLSVSAGTSRQSLAVTQAQIRAAEASIDLAQAQRRPSISLNPGLLFSNPASFLGRFAASIGLGVSQTLFSGGRIASQVAEAKATLEQTRQNYAGQVLQVQNSIEGSLLTLDSAQRRLASADVAVNSGREAVRAAQLGFEAGARTSLDVSNAQAALLSAQTESVNARYDVAGAQANLAASVGVLSGPASAALNSDEARQAAQAATEAARQDNSQRAPKGKRRKFLGIF